MSLWGAHGFPGAVMWLGAHIGISGGIENSPGTARSIGADVMQIFSKNQRQWRVPEIPPETAQAFRSAVQQHSIQVVAIHAAYLINLGSSEDPLQGKSRAGLVDELRRAEVLGVPYVILHPGAHKGAGIDQGLSTIAEGARFSLDATEGSPVRLLLENAAGAGSTMGQSFEELARLYQLIDRPDRIGCCVDTCHAFVSGMDFRTEPGYESFIERIESTIGLSTVRCFHLNDAQFELGSHRDRHANIGAGHIGKEGFRWLMNDPRMAHAAGILETPISEDPDHPYAAYETDLETLRSLVRTPGGGAPRARPDSTHRR